jgi:putative flippase GtrA
MKVVRYFFVGGVAATVDIGLFTVFAYWLGYNYLVVGACTFILATLVNYILSVRYVFESGVRFTPGHEISLVYLVSGAGLILNQLILFACVEFLVLDKLLSKVIATASIFLWNFLLRSYFIFNKKSLS